MARLFRVILPVSDIERAARFYATVLDTPGQRVSPGRHYFDCEGVVLACYDPAADGDNRSPMPVPETFYFAVDDLETAFRQARRAGASIPRGELPDVGVLGEISMRPWGERSFYVWDPFGNPLCFVARETVFTG